MNNNIDIIGHVEKTGHYYKRLHMEAYESVDNCGTCDGVCCDICRDIYVVENVKTCECLYRGADKEKSIQIAGYDFVR